MFKIAVVQPKVPLGRFLIYSKIYSNLIFFSGQIIVLLMNPGFESLWSGVDPKSILCEFFKAGQCAKGFKCKFSHDLNIQRKGEKIDIFSDKRDEGIFCFKLLNLSPLHSCHDLIWIITIPLICNMLLGTMEDWDQETLEKVVESKGKEYNQNKPTDIVCSLNLFKLFPTMLILFMTLSLHTLPTVCIKIK